MVNNKIKNGNSVDCFLCMKDISNVSTDFRENFKSRILQKSQSDEQILKKSSDVADQDKVRLHSFVFFQPYHNVLISFH